MADTCSILSIPAKAPYTDEEARQHAEEVGVNPRPKETRSEIDERGAFIRQPNAFIKPFGDREEDNKAETDRFAIYWAHGCHWSNRPVIVRDILGLTKVIRDVATTHSGETNLYGHGFADGKDQKDPLCGAYFLSEFYKNADPSFTGRATTPTLVDIKEKKAVNNDYHRLTNYIEVQFRKFQPADAPDLYPVKYRREIDEFNDWLFPTINNGHYRMAFCQSWEAYDEAYNDFFESVEKLDKRLEMNRFLFGDYITDSDIRLYVSLVRWETSYYHNIGPMKKRITEYKNLWGYVKDLYSLDVFKKYTFFEFPKNDVPGIFASYPKRIAAQVPYEELWAADGSRKAFSQEYYQSVISTTKWNSKDWADRNPMERTLSKDAAINAIESKLRD